MPGMLRGFKQYSIATSTDFWDDFATTAPFGIAPTGIQKMAHGEANVQYLEVTVHHYRTMYYRNS